jgi:hypothetical protein
MKFSKWLNEKETIDYSKVEKIKQVFSKIPGNTPESVAKYITNTMKAVGLKPKSEGMTYIAGPMTNLPDDNWATFIYAEKYIGGKIFNPAKPHGSIIKKQKSDFKWEDYMIEDMYNILKCNRVVVLPGYTNSTGAKVETLIAKNLLRAKIVSLRQAIGKKYDTFVEDVRQRFYNDGFQKEFDAIIYPMLMASSEKEAAKRVVSHIPKGTESSVNEGVVDNIKDFINIIKTKSLQSILRVIGVILDKSGIKGMKR